MKVSHSCIGLLAGLMFMWTASAYDFTYDAGDIEGSKSSTGITYTLSVSKGNLGTSYDFDTKAGVTSGAPSGIDINVSSGGATGTMEYANDSLPTSNFTISMNGKLLPPSGGEGSQPTWGASGNAKAPFHIKSDQNGGEKEIVVPHGTSVKYSAYQGTSLQNSTWSVTGFPSKDAEEIRFNKSFWVSLWPWSASNITDPEPGVYNISATAKSPGTGSDSGKMTVVGIQEVKAKIESNDYITVSGTLLILSGTIFKVKAFPSPDVTWPASTPTWKTAGDGWFSSRVSSSAAEEKTVDTSGTEEEFDVIAMCGTHEAKITVTIFNVEVTHMAFYGSSTDCYSLKASSTGANISVPEVTPSGGDKKVLLGANKDISVKARLITDPSVTVSGVKIKSDVPGYDIVELSETSVSFSNGVSSGSAVGSTNGFVTFSAKNKSKNSIGKNTASFVWKFTGVNDYTLSSPKSLNTISGITIYTILDAPKGPWSGNPVWINALDFAITTCNAQGKTATSAMDAITRRLYSIPYQGNSAYYVMNGDFNYTGYMSMSVANCFDSALGLSTTAQLLGIDTISRRRTDFFNFNQHCFVLYRGNVYDSTSAMTFVVVNVDYATYISWGTPAPTSTEISLTANIK